MDEYLDKPQKVRIVDVHIPFLSLLGLLIKIWLAGLVLWGLTILVFAIVSGIFRH